MAESVRRAIENILAKCGVGYVLKDEQMRIIYSLLDGQHTVGILPIGYGKSLPYIIFPLVKDSVSIPFWKLGFFFWFFFAYIFHF
jgi:superfamily II DNA helicase RecQ